VVVEIGKPARRYEAAASDEEGRNSSSPYRIPVFLDVTPTDIRLRKAAEVPTNASIREEITKQIITAIESGKTLPWRKPWTTSPNAGRAANVVSKRPYTGINPLLLELHRLKHGFSSRWYGTFRQWADLGLAVKKRPNHIEPGLFSIGPSQEPGLIPPPVMNRKTSSSCSAHTPSILLIRSLALRLSR
jgi:hypothetical protein